MSSHFISSAYIIFYSTINKIYIYIFRQKCFFFFFRGISGPSKMYLQRYFQSEVQSKMASHRFWRKFARLLTCQAGNKSGHQTLNNFGLLACFCANSLFLRNERMICQKTRPPTAFFIACHAEGPDGPFTIQSFKIRRSKNFIEFRNVVRCPKVVKLLVGDPGSATAAGNNFGQGSVKNDPAKYFHSFLVPRNVDRGLS